LKYRNGLRFVIAERYTAALPVSSRFLLTTPSASVSVFAKRRAAKKTYPTAKNFRLDSFIPNSVDCVQDVMTAHRPFT
jgi:hypothetical protein